MWFIGVEVEQEMSAPLPKKNPGSAPKYHEGSSLTVCQEDEKQHTAELDDIAIPHIQKLQKKILKKKINTATP